jgi:hypothetical protein
MVRSPAGPTFVVAIWEEVAEHSLSHERRAEFLARIEFAELAEYAEAVLRPAAALAVERNTHGYLLLDEWLECCPVARGRLADAQRATGRTIDIRDGQWGSRPTSRPGQW